MCHMNKSKHSSMHTRIPVVLVHIDWDDPGYDRTSNEILDTDSFDTLFSWCEIFSRQDLQGSATVIFYMGCDMITEQPPITPK